MAKKIVKKEMVAEVQYRCSGNYKTNLIMLIPEGKKFKVGDDVEVGEFGITDKEWYGGLIPGKYDATLDHNLLEIQAIRERGEDDFPVNAD